MKMMKMSKQRVGNDDDNEDDEAESKSIREQRPSLIVECRI